MNPPNDDTVNRSFRDRSKNLLRDNKLFVSCELIIAVVIVGGSLTGVIPPSGILFLLLFGWLSLWLRGIGWREIGLRHPARWGYTLLSAVIVGIAYQFLSIYALDPLIVLVTSRPVDLSQFAPIKGNTAMLVGFLVTAWTVIAFGEELIFRGYLLNRVAGLSDGDGLTWAVSLVVVSVLFGVGHLYQGVSGVIDNIFSGLVFGGLYLWSGRNLWWPIIAHGVYDSVAFVLIFLDKYPGL